MPTSVPRVSFFLSHEQFGAPELLQQAVVAAEAGFDAVATSDHFHPWQDNEGHAGQAWVTLSAIGQLVPQIPFGTTVTCPTYRYHPAIVAQAFASLAVLYPGRVYLGLGTGEALNEQPVTSNFGDYEERRGRLREAAEIITRLWSGQWTTYEGRYYAVKDARLYDAPPEPIPLLIAAAGPKSARLAGELGAGLITGAETLMKGEVISAFREAYKGSGEPRIMVEQMAIAGGEAEARESGELWRFHPKAFQGMHLIPDPREIQRRAEREIPMEKLIESQVIGASGEPHLERIRNLAEAGATDIVIHSGQSDQLWLIDLYGDQVLPQLRAGAGGGPGRIREEVAERDATRGMQAPDGRARPI